MNPFQSLHEYETFIYTLPQRYPHLVRSTLTVIRRSRLRAEVVGEVHWKNGIRLAIFEYLNCEAGAVEIVVYSYEVLRGTEKLYWYDSQPHPNEPMLASTQPHHKHVPPDIKHHRIPAPELSFTRPNLAFLICEIDQQFPQPA
ncbi:MAG: DUF6516 family protein [Desulfoferrobacter sp.]